MSRIFLLLLLVSTLLMQGYVVRAQEDGTDSDEGTAEPEATSEGDAEQPTGEATETVDQSEDLSVGPADDADIHVIFPDYPDLKFPAGAVVDSVIGVHNKGQNTYTLQAMRGSFNRPQDYAYIQNFSTTTMQTVVEPDQHVTLVYRFKVHESFEPQDFAFQLIMLLSDVGKRQYVQPLFNSTISVVDAEADPHGPGIIYYGTLLALLGGVAYVVLQHVQASNPKKAAKIETGTRNNAGVQDEWLQDINVAGSAKKRKPAAAQQ